MGKPLVHKLLNVWYTITGHGSDAVWETSFKAVFEVISLHNLEHLQVLSDMFQNQPGTDPVPEKEFKLICTRFKRWMDRLVYPYRISCEIGAGKKPTVIIIDQPGAKPRMVV